MKKLEQQVANLQAELLQAQSKVKELETLRHSCVCVYACVPVSLFLFLFLSLSLSLSVCPQGCKLVFVYCIQMVLAAFLNH